MTIELLLSVIIACVGWAWAIFQFSYKRKWQKKDLLASRRYEAYSQFMRKCEEINDNIRKDPKAIYIIAQESLSRIITSSNPNDVNNALIEFNNHLFDHVKHLNAALSIINYEISPLLLIASIDVTKKLEELKKLITDFGNEIQNCLNKINVKDGSSFKTLETIGQNNRLEQFEELINETIILMRQEINIE